MMKNSILYPTPHQVFKIWGGRRLANIFNLDTTEKVGESWVVSRHHDGPSRVNGESLDRFLDETQLPYLVKLLDTSDNLSVQVHPDDEYARQVESSSGKTECWLILDAKPGAGIYLGLKEGVSKEDFSKALENKDNLSGYLKYFPVSKHDFFFVPAGTIHAIGKDVFLAEIQQSSGITYRVWDWNRLDDQGNSRELHIKQALDVTNFESDFNSIDYFRHSKASSHLSELVTLTSFKDFEVRLVQNTSGGELETIEKTRFHSVLVLEGELILGDKKLKSYETAIIPNQIKMDFTCSQETKFLHIL